ncbi:hypothetical protein EDC04DRAFT_2901763 [Pisolithus marmoratus]|nr:hypothetical protein EDC04DRAFT_2901763 [Pisolithus marmoratus]
MFFRASNTQEVVDGMQDFGFEDKEDYGNGADMDVTEAISHNILHKQSLLLGGPQEPLSSLTGQHKEQSFVEEDSVQSHSLGPEGDTSQPMEFTVPLVHPMAPPSEAWLALQAIMHSGNMPFIPSDDDEENGGDSGKLSVNFAPPTSHPVPEKRSTTAAQIPDGQSSPAKKPSGPQKLTTGLTHPDLPQPSNASSKLWPSKPTQPQIKQGTQSEAGLGKHALLGTLVSTDDTNQSSQPSSPNKQAMGSRRKSIAVARDVEGVQSQFKVSAEKGGTGRDCMAWDPSTMGDMVETVEQMETQATPSPKPHETLVVSKSSHDDLPGEPSLLLSSQQVLAADSMSDVAEDMGDDADDEVLQNSLPTGEPTTDVTEQWQEDIQRPGSEGEEGLLISIEQFFEMTGI